MNDLKPKPRYVRLELKRLLKNELPRLKRKLKNLPRILLRMPWKQMLILRLAAVKNSHA